MPAPKKERNKEIVQLAKVGFPRLELSKIYKIEKRNLKRLIIRDWDKYEAPTLLELKTLEKIHGIVVGTIIAAEKPVINHKTNVNI